jgi:hypothetical protein
MHHAFMRYSKPCKDKRLLSIWRGIIKRCDPRYVDRYKNYAGKGVNVLWKSYEEFEEDMYAPYAEHVRLYGEKETTIDRIDFNKGYSKENCRWATWSEQHNNRSTTNKLTFNGKTQSITQWATELGINRGSLSSRINRQKWSIEDALTLPKLKVEEHTSKTFAVVDPSGKEHTGFNLSEFCRKNGLIPSAFGNIKRGKSKTHLGWTIKK